MAEQNGSTIAEVPLVFGELSGREKMPVSNGTGKDLTVSVEQIARYSLPTGTTTAEFSISDDLGHEILRLEGGHIRTKNFDSSNIKENKDGVEEAPQNGGKFVRQNGKWVPESNGGGGIHEAPSDGNLYGRKNGSWAKVPTNGSGIVVEQTTGYSKEATMSQDAITRALQGSGKPVISPEFKGKTYVSFGTSITRGYGSSDGRGWPPAVASKFGMKLLNLGFDNSAPHDTQGRLPWSLGDNTLNKVPEDTMLVTICYGANEWKTGKIEKNTDRTNSIGAINYAIDFIRQKCPKAVIVVGPDLGGRRGTPCKDLKALAEYRNLGFAETYLIDNCNADNPRSDHTSRDKVGLHPNDYGYAKFAAAIINEVSKFIYC